MFVGSNGDGTWYIEHRTACVLAVLLPLVIGLLLISCIDTALERKRKADDEHIKELIRTELKRQTP